MIRPSLLEIKNMSKQYSLIPITMEIFADEKTTVQILKTLLKNKKKCYLLESVLSEKNWGRYSFLGYDPVESITCNNNNIVVKNKKVETFYREDPLEYLDEVIEKNRSPKFDYLPPFTGGLVGYFSYDCIKYVEKGLKLENSNEDNFDDYNFMLFDKVIAFDHLKQKIFLITNISMEKFEENYINGIQVLKDMEYFVLGESVKEEFRGKITSEIKPEIKKEEFIEIVKKTKEHIYEGDIFQAVLSNRFEAEFEGSLLQTYRILRTSNPSPYMFYMNFGNIEIAGASPETLLSLKDREITTYALAGTCKRGENEAEDKRFIDSLLRDEKELSEHNMLVDLSRNDLGKICEFGTEKVKDYKNILKFSHVSHIASVVAGKTKEDITQIDAIKAILPAGTLSGAPKRRACEIIENLENKKRGTYGGAIGYMDFTGNMDMCIAIRMVKKQNGKIFIQSGAGIVYDSDPESEYNECINKSKAIIKAIEEN